MAPGLPTRWVRIPPVPTVKILTGLQSLDSGRVDPSGYQLRSEPFVFFIQDSFCSGCTAKASQLGATVGRSRSPVTISIASAASSASTASTASTLNSQAAGNQRHSRVQSSELSDVEGIGCNRVIATLAASRELINAAVRVTDRDRIDRRI